MSITKRRQIKSKQKNKRRETRLKLKAKGLNPDDFYASGICLKSPK